LLHLLERLNSVYCLVSALCLWAFLCSCGLSHWHLLISSSTKQLPPTWPQTVLHHARPFFLILR
jgi:hypothetical protein